MMQEATTREVEIARQQGAKMLELRAAVNLARLRQTQDWQAAARILLAENDGLV